MSFKRNLVAAKRVLSFDASIFVGIFVDIQMKFVTVMNQKECVSQFELIYL